LTTPVAAGIVKVPSDLDLAKRAVSRLSDAEWAELVRWREAGCPEG
jgi:hypothetical protein